MSLAYTVLILVFAVICLAGTISALFATERRHRSSSAIYLLLFTMCVLILGVIKPGYTLYTYDKEENLFHKEQGPLYYKGYPSKYVLIEHINKQFDLEFRHRIVALPLTGHKSMKLQFKRIGGHAPKLLKCNYIEPESGDSFQFPNLVGDAINKYFLHKEIMDAKNFKRKKKLLAKMESRIESICGVKLDISILSYGTHQKAPK